MKPEQVLCLELGENPAEKLQLWKQAYENGAKTFPDAEALAQQLIARAEQACACLLATDDAVGSESFDGAFPLGCFDDMAFVKTLFSVSDIVTIQLGHAQQIDCGVYTEYNEAVLMREGFLAELRGDWLEAARCYAGVTRSASVQTRETMCRNRAETLGQTTARARNSHRLRVVELAWWVDRHTGERTVRKTEEQTVCCVEGARLFFAKGRRSFVVDQVTGDEVVVSTLLQDNTVHQTWTLYKGDTQNYRPRFLDAGFQYRIIFD